MSAGVGKRPPADKNYHPGIAKQHFQAHALKQPQNAIITWRCSEVPLGAVRQSATCAVANRRETKNASNEIRIRSYILPPAGETLAYLDAAAKLRIGKQCVRLLIDAKHLCETPTELGRRITRTSIEQFAADYVSLQAIAYDQKMQPRTIRKACEQLGFHLLTFRSREFKHSFASGEDVPLILKSFGSEQSGTSLASKKERSREEAA